METDIEKKGPELDTPGTTTALRIGDTTLVETTRQGVPFENPTNVPLGTNAGEEHPYTVLRCMLEQALVMLYQTASQPSKPRCVLTLKATANYIKRTSGLLPMLFRARDAGLKDLQKRLEKRLLAGRVKALLKEGIEKLRITNKEASVLSLLGVQEILKTPTALVEQAHQKVANFIAADSGKSTVCELVLGGGSANE